MAIRKITEYPEEVLGQMGKPVEKFDAELEALCEDMFETMYDAEGVGLAAPQIGLNLRLFVMDCDGIKLIAANPEIVHTEGEQTGQEGCLSVGKVPAAVTRPMKARLRAQDERRMVRKEAEAMPPVLFSTKRTTATENSSSSICQRCRDMVVNASAKKRAGASGFFSTTHQFFGSTGLLPRIFRRIIIRASTRVSGSQIYRPQLLSAQVSLN